MLINPSFFDYLGTWNAGGIRLGAAALTCEAPADDDG